MKVTHTKDFMEHRVSISNETTWGKHGCEVELIGRGETKHEAIQEALEAVKHLENSIKMYRKELVEL